MIYMDDHTGQNETSKLRTCAQRATTNIHVGKIEHLLLSCVFLLPTGEEGKLISIFPTQNQSKSA
jgi:hypothetical protein